MQVKYVSIFLLTQLLLFRGKLAESKKFEFEKFEDPGGPWGRQPIILSGGGYSNILLALNDDVKESPAVIENIMTFFTRTSNILSSKSDGALYFKEISILVPGAWDLNHLYDRPRPNETYGTARIVLRNSSSQGSPPSVPFVLHPGGCGEEGAYMYLPESKLSSTNNESEQIFLNLWSELRWGFQQRSILTSQQEPSYCSTNTHFRKRSGRKINVQTQWETLLSNTKDYQSSPQNKAESRSRDTTPAFRILRPTDIYSVVIIDARENMMERSKYERMVRMLQHYSWQYFPTHSRVGIVSINGTSEKIRACIKIWEHYAFRWLLYQGLPQSPTGSSSLGKAVLLAIQVLSNSTKGYLRDSNIFIMSDGTDIVPPTISDVQQEIDSSGVTLVSLPFSSNPSENIQLGNTIKAYENSSYNHMDRLEDTDRVVHISSIDDFCIDDVFTTLPVVVDETSRYQKVVLRIHGFDVSKIFVAWSGTEGQFYVAEYYRRDEYPDLQDEVADFMFDLAVTGEFEVFISSNETQCVDVDVYIADLLAPAPGEAITDERVKLDVIFKDYLVDYSENRDGIPVYAALTKNEKPVVNASVVVRVIDPSDNVTVIQMQDTGMGIDSAKEDGVYSVLYSTFTLEGYYELIIEVLRSSSCLMNMQNLTTSYCVPMQPFTRYRSDVTFTVLGIPPNRINDLKVEWVIKRTASISWTAPGQDSTYGNAKYYDMRYSDTMEMLTKDFINATNITNILSGSLSNPSASGSLESITVSFSNFPRTDLIYVAVRAVDEHNNIADVSNIVSIRFEPEFFTTPILEDTTELSLTDLKTTLKKTTIITVEKDTTTKIAASTGTTESLDSLSHTNIDTTSKDPTINAASNDETVKSSLLLVSSTDKMTEMENNTSGGEPTELNYRPGVYGGPRKMTSFKPATESITPSNGEVQMTEAIEVIEPTVTSDEPKRELTDHGALDMSIPKATVLNTIAKTTALLQHITKTRTTNSRISNMLTSSVTQNQTTMKTSPISGQLRTSTSSTPVNKHDVKVPTVHSGSKYTMYGAITMNDIDTNTSKDKTPTPKTTHKHVFEVKPTKNLENMSFLEMATETISSDTFKAAVVTGGVVTLASVTGLFLILKKRKISSGVSHVEKQHAGNELGLL